MRASASKRSEHVALFRRGGKDPAPQDAVETETDEPTAVDDGPDEDGAMTAFFDQDDEERPKSRFGRRR